MQITRSMRFFGVFHPYQLWRFLVLNVKILRGVDRSKRLPEFRVKYKMRFVVPDSDIPSVIANTSRPHDVGDVLKLLDHEVEIVEVRQMMRPRGEFTFLEAVCRPVETSADVETA